MRKVLLVIMAVAALVATGCKHTTGPGTMNFSEEELLASVRNSCKSNGSGNPDKKRPLVCVSIDKGGASVDPILIKADKKNYAGNNNKLRFLSRDSDEYVIEFTSTNCTVQTGLPCVEACAFDINQSAANGQRCEYAVVLTRVVNGETVTIRLDPIVIIDTN